MRRCYATTGVHALIDVRVNGYPMGSDIKSPKNEIDLELDVKSPLNIVKIEIFENEKLIKRLFGESKHEYMHLKSQKRNAATTSYIAIVDFEGYERVWSSPLRVGSV